MVFSSLVFLFAYFPLTLVIMKLTPIKYRNVALLIVSLFFYGWSEPKYIFLMIFSCVVNYYLGHLIAKPNKDAKKILIAVVVFNLGLLGFFKYYDFFVGILNDLGLRFLTPLKLPLPVGISFYTFQAMSYPIDIYRKQADEQKSLVNFICYVTCFPQLIAGPIVRYKDIAKQLESRIETADQFYEGIVRFVNGLAKKVLLANNAGALWEAISATSSSQMSTALAWLGIIAYAFQIYFDFSGYSDMAIGLGKMFGFDFLENFNYPYIASSITDFWRRWHISLSTWFKDYVYIPLGGSRHGIVKTCRNLLIVWMLTGFWHGASWNFILWGLFYGLILMFEKLIGLRWLAKMPSFFRHFYALFLVMIGWVLFAFNDLSAIGAYLKLMFGQQVLFNDLFLYYLRNNIFLLVVCTIASTPVVYSNFNPLRHNRQLEVFVPVIVMILMFLCVSFICDATYNPFLYFRF
ncbi:MAG: MBOAT family protein [Erysipelotrichaceae bacterium]|nr:MBOAT family protein [Erysipelotrichaceae bacterium]MDY5251653.1 MBOAT family O-acyltransferase [Erysipelotrichaceae bacterium]